MPRSVRLLAQSDALVRELQAADVLVIGTPIYNFSIPASLKSDRFRDSSHPCRYPDAGRDPQAPWGDGTGPGRVTAQQSGEP